MNEWRNGAMVTTVTMVAVTVVGVNGRANVCAHEACLGLFGLSTSKKGHLAFQVTLGEGQTCGMRKVEMS